MDFTKDYYEILAVPRDATKEQIKAAYRRMAKQYHPDRNPGDVVAGERIKDVNEAYDLLYNDLTRHTYDEYLRELTQIQQRTAKQGKEVAVDEKNKRRYVRVHTIYKEKRTYLKGILKAKFWGELLAESQLLQEREVNYHIHPTDVTVKILQTDIHPLTSAPLPFQKSYQETELFTTPLRQPVHCIIKTDEGEELYALELKEIRVKAPVISDVTKHDGTSFGILTGELYAYVQEVIQEEIDVMETECFGPSGAVEFKEEDGQVFMRKEVYNTDCSRTWGPWEVIGQRPSTTSGGRKGVRDAGLQRPGNWGGPVRRPAPVTSTQPESGCLEYWWVVPLLLLGVFFPPLLAAFGLLAGFVAALHLLGFLFSRVRLLMSVLAVCFVAFSVYSVIWAERHPSPVPRSTADHASVSTTTETIVKTSSSTTNDSTGTGNTASSATDTLISHVVRWQDYDSVPYEARLSVLASQLRTSIAAHRQLQAYPFAGWTPLYTLLEREDEPKMQGIYAAFDSIRLARGLTERTFANMVVSCIQSLPYYLVLDRDCNAANYGSDDYVYNYLSTCTKECCVGNEAFGIASPVEFIGNLKGDCDTRALVLYCILKKFGYQVALLTSDYYKHAVIAVHFREELNLGLTMNIQNKNYYLWETTSPGFQPGVLPPALQNLRHWTVSLLNTNN